MSVQEAFLRPMTPDEYLAWEERQTERHEYINGVIRAMSEIGRAHV